MKKLSLLAIFALSLFSAKAQDSNSGLEIGLKISPSISSNRVVAPGEFGIENDGASGRFGVGLVFDYFFGENYAFSTGLEYSSKGSGVKYEDREVPGTMLTDEFNVQYLQIPLGFKLFTNEVATDMRVYFQLGTSINARISSKVDDEKFYLKANGESAKTNNRFNLFEMDAVLGSGVELQLGANTKVFGGISYHRGLSNIDSYYEDYYKNKPGVNSQDIAIKNNIFALDLGLKF